MPPGGLSFGGDGEHAQVEVGVGGDEEDFLDLRGAVSLAVPSDDEIAFLVRAGCGGGLPFRGFESGLGLRQRVLAPSDLGDEFLDFSVVHGFPRDSYARPTVWGMKSPAGGGRGVGCYAFSAILSLLAGTVHFPS